jgi:hypothetical protein
VLCSPTVSKLCVFSVPMISRCLLVLWCGLWLWFGALPGVTCRGNSGRSKRKYNIQSPPKIRQDVQQFQDSGQYVDLVHYLEAIIEKQGSLVIDDQLPSLYNFYGVALHSIQKVEEAENAFVSCVHYNPKDSRSLLLRTIKFIDSFTPLHLGVGSILEKLAFINSN